MEQQVREELGRDSPDWRLRHACPACTYKLKNEHPLLYKLLFCMDGNDSLKRILRRFKEEDGSTGPTKERLDSRTIDGDFYLAKSEVDKWANEALEDLLGHSELDKVKSCSSVTFTKITHQFF